MSMRIGHHSKMFKEQALSHPSRGREGAGMVG